MNKASLQACYLTIGAMNRLFVNVCLAKSMFLRSASMLFPDMNIDRDMLASVRRAPGDGGHSSSSKAGSSIDGRMSRLASISADLLNASFDCPIVSSSSVSI